MERENRKRGVGEAAMRRDQRGGSSGRGKNEKKNEKPIYPYETMSFQCKMHQNDIVLTLKIKIGLNRSIH